MKNVSPTFLLGSLDHGEMAGPPLVSFGQSPRPGRHCCVTINDDALDAYLASSKQAAYMLVESLRLTANAIAKTKFSTVGRPVGRHWPEKDFRKT